MRIGINSSSVFVGNMGTEERIDLTIIGDGVNLAQRLEAAAEPYRILLGAGTCCKTLSDRYGNALCSRLISAKRHEKIIHAYEMDPFAAPADRKTIQSVMLKFTSTHGISRKTNRVSVNTDGLIAIQTEFGNGSLVNVSETGVGVVLDSYLGKATLFNLKLIANNMLAHRLIASNCGEFAVRVQWGSKIEGGYYHGCEIVGVNLRLRDELVLIVSSRRQESGETIDVPSAAGGPP